MDVHVAMSSGCMGSCVKTGLASGKDMCISHKQLLVNMTQEQLKENKYQVPKWQKFFYDFISIKASC